MWVVKKFKKKTGNGSCLQGIIGLSEFLKIHWD
jgi:hypothetical protein